jgi:hypothetical protein
MKTAKQQCGIHKYGDRYTWTHLRHSELVEFIESRRIKTNLTKQGLSLAAGYNKNNYCNMATGSHRFSRQSFELIAKAVIEAADKQLQIPMDILPERIEAPAKLEKPIYGVMSIEQMITKIKAAGYKVMKRTEGWEEI